MWGVQTWLKIVLAMSAFMMVSLLLPDRFLLVAVSLQVGSLIMVGIRTWQTRARIWTEYLAQCHEESISQASGSVLSKICKSLLLLFTALAMSTAPLVAAFFAVSVARDFSQAPNEGEAIRNLLGVAFFSLGCLVLAGLVLFLWWEAVRKIHSYFRPLWRPLLTKLEKMMKAFLLVAAVTLSAGFLISWNWEPLPYEEQLIQLQVEMLLPGLATDLRKEKIELRAQLVDYAKDPLLLAQARVALLQYPEISRPILETYGAHPAFQKVLRKYGGDILMPIQYFRTHEIATIAIREKFLGAGSWLATKVRAWFGGGKPSSDTDSLKSSKGMSPDERVMYAINFIDNEGHNFLGQFVVTDGKVSWLRSERALEGIESFLFSGMLSLEKKHHLNQEKSFSDWGWAFADVAVGAGTLKVLKGVSKAGKSMNFSKRAMSLSPVLSKGGSVASKLIKYGSPIALTYLAIKHPSLLNSIFRFIAETFNFPTLLIQALGWALTLSILFYFSRLMFWPIRKIINILTSGSRTPKTQPDRVGNI